MKIDIICLCILAYAAFRGYRTGLIVALASFAGFFIGLAAAMKLSATLASGIGSGSSWLPFLAFILVFFITSWLVGIMGRFIHKGSDMMMAGPANRIGGIAVYLCTGAFILGLFLFFAGRSAMISPDTIASSYGFRYLEPMGRYLIDGIGDWIPFFRGMFSELLEFFDSINKDLANP